MNRTRRGFLRDAAAWAFVAATHAPALLASAEARLPEPAPDGEARIRSLRLRTSEPLERMEAYYRDLLGMPVLERRPDRLTVLAGPSRITFLAVPGEPPDTPFYHVAFNIPENKHEGSKRWLVDSGIGIHRLAHFRSWNAHAAFFLDPAGNILEFIARHDLKNAAAGSFAPQRDILCASEIAFIVDDVPAFAAGMRTALRLDDYRPGANAYSIIGDEHGLLLVFKTGRAWYRPAQSFPAEVVIRGGDGLRFAPDGHPYDVLAGPVG